MREKDVILIELETQSVIPDRMRHIIRRYLRYAGLKHADVVHRYGNTPLTLKIVVEASISEPLTAKQERKIGVLASAIESLLERADVRGAEIDTEELRNILVKEEPSLRKVYYRIE